MSTFCPQRISADKINIIKTDNSEGKKTSFIIAIGAGNNPMVGMTVACAVAIEEASK